MITSSTKIKRVNNIDQGTLGGFFQFENEDAIYGISNNHVIANLNNCNLGDKICDENNNIIGNLSDWIFLSPEKNNFSEFALFKLSEGQKYQWNSWNGTSEGKPKGYALPEQGLQVIYPNNKNIHGKISQTNKSVYAEWKGLKYIFKNCLEIKSSGSKPFSYHMDSGGAIFTLDNFLVGIIFGINESNSSCFAYPFEGNILNYFNLKIA